MPTPVKLFHIGEAILARLLQELADRGDLEVPCVVHEDCTVAAILRDGGVVGRLRFASDVPLRPIAVGDGELQFDGAHCVDVLACQEVGDAGVAFEAKLGIDRLSQAEFTRRFLVKPSRTRHKIPRIQGSMVAILNYRVDGGFGELPVCADLERARRLAPSWVLVVRCDTWRQWSARGVSSPKFGPTAHVVCFETVAARYGGAQEFDALVCNIVGDSFALEWGLGLNSRA